MVDGIEVALGVVEKEEIKKSGRQRKQKKFFDEL